MNILLNELTVWPTKLNWRSLDLRYEGFRLKAAGAGGAAFGLDCPARHRGAAGRGGSPRQRSVLLNGFKRYRCARKLRLATVPYSSLGPDEAAGILSLLRTSNNRALSILEQAAFIAELKNARQMSVARDRRRAFPEQILGEHAPGTHGRDERHGAPATLRRGLSGLFLHVCCCASLCA